MDFLFVQTPPPNSWMRKKNFFMIQTVNRWKRSKKFKINYKVVEEQQLLLFVESRPFSFDWIILVF